MLFENIQARILLELIFGVLGIRYEAHMIKKTYTGEKRVGVTQKERNLAKKTTFFRTFSKV